MSPDTEADIDIWLRVQTNNETDIWLMGQTDTDISVFWEI